MGYRFKVVRVDRIANMMPELTSLKEEQAELSAVNAQAVFADSDSEAEIIRLVKDADAIVTTEAKITRRIMEAAPLCKVIVRYGIGYDVVDIDAATDNGIVVVNVPDYCLEEVSNHALAFLLACAKKLVLLNNRMKWEGYVESKALQAPMGSIYGETLGLVGCGNIGRLTARKAKCFSLDILGYDPFVDEPLVKECGITLVSLPELLKRADYVSVHTPLSKGTRHLIGEREFRQMKPTAYFINTSRGSVVDEPALIKALREKTIAGAALDVFEEEPIRPDNPLLTMDNVIVTPHAASYSDASLQRLKRSVGQEVARVLSGRWPRNLVNKSVKPKTPLTR